MTETTTHIFPSLRMESAISAADALFANNTATIIAAFFINRLDGFKLSILKLRHKRSAKC